MYHYLSILIARNLHHIFHLTLDKNKMNYKVLNYLIVITNLSMVDTYVKASGLIICSILEALQLEIGKSYLQVYIHILILAC